MPSFYPQVSSKAYVNIFYSMCIHFDNFISKLILNEDDSRIVYSSTDYALIKRSGKEEWNNANLPFLNYKLSGKSIGGTRNWFSMQNFSQGVFIPELRKKIRIAPISIELDCTYWTSRDDDWQYAVDTLLIKNFGETKFSYDMDFSGTIVSNIAIVEFNLDTSPRYTEQDWLEKNEISTFSLNPTIQTFLPLDTAEGFCIPKTLLMDFLVKKDIINQGEVVEYDEALEFTIDHFNQTIIEK